MNRVELLTKTAKILPYSRRSTRLVVWKKIEIWSQMSLTVWDGTVVYHSNLKCANCHKNDATKHLIQYRSTQNDDSFWKSPKEKCQQGFIIRIWKNRTYSFTELWKLTISHNKRLSLSWLRRSSWKSFSKLLMIAWKCLRKDSQRTAITM